MQVVARLERQRNELVMIVERYISDLDESGDEAWAKGYRRWLNQILLENVDVDAPAHD